MTNFEWVKERIIREVDTPEKMADAMIGGFKFDDLEEELAGFYCIPEKVGCSDETKLNAVSYVAPCEECAKKWLDQEH